MRHIFLAGLCSLWLVACGWPSKSSSSLRAAAGARVLGLPG